MRIPSLLLSAIVSVMPLYTLAVASSSSKIATVQTSAPIAQAISAVAKGSDIHFVQTSRQVSLGKQADGRYTMLMSGISPRMLWFTDGADRSAGIGTIAYFIEDWKKERSSFIVDRSSAVLTANTKMDGSGQNVLKMVELSQPVYNKANDTLSYTVNVVLDINHNVTNTYLYHGTLLINSTVAG